MKQQGKKPVANEPDIIQKLSVDFNIVNDLNVDFTLAPQQVLVQTNSDASVDAQFNSDEQVDAQFASNIKPLDAQFGTIYVVSGDCKVLYATTETWNSKPKLVSARGFIYIYSDYRKDEHGRDIAAMKVGDGSAYLIDMPFTDDLLYAHAANSDIHITPEEREFWNNKVRCYVDPINQHRLVFTTK